MDKEKLQQAFTAYSETRDLQALAQTFKELLLFMAQKAKHGYDIEFLNTLPFVIEFLTTLDLKKDQS